MSAGEDVADDLVRDVDLLCLDAGNTVIFLDHERLARILRETAGLDTSANALVVSEGEAKRLAETGGLHDAAWEYRARPGAVAWGKMVGTIAVGAGLAEADVPRVLAVAWREHEQKNLWCKVPDGLGAALDELRGTGARVIVVSNSEGMLERLFRDLGIWGHFDAIVDSGLVGVEKPDPRIFAMALERAKATADRALHLGDVFATDILGARAAGIRHALIDPFGHYAGRHPEVPRVPGAAPVARAISCRRSSTC